MDHFTSKRIDDDTYLLKQCTQNDINMNKQLWMMMRT